MCNSWLDSNRIKHLFLCPIDYCTVFFNNKVRCGTLERAGLCLSIEQNTFTVITKMAFCSAHYLTVESCAAARGQNIIAAFKMLLQPSCYLPLIIWYSLIVIVSISSIYIIGL